MADPASMATMAMVGMAGGGIANAAGSITGAMGKQLGIQGQMLNTVGQAFGMRVQAQNYLYKANVDAYQAGVAKVNQQIALQNASYSRDVGEVTAEQEGLKTRAMVSSAKATQGASGIDVNSRSSSDVRESMVEIGQYDQNMVRANAAKVAYGYEVEATQDDAQARLYTYSSAEDVTQAANALTGANLAMEAIPLEQQAYTLAGVSGVIGAAGSLIGGAGSTASSYMKYNQYFT